MRLIPLLAFAFIAVPPAVADDADTLTHRSTPYRLDGIDAPEIDQPCLDEKGVVYPCGQFAYRALRRLIAGRPLHCDDLRADRIHRERRVGWCAVNGTNLNHWLVQQGWALNFEDFARGRFLRDERQARQRRAGMWQGCFVAPTDFRNWRKHTARLLGPHCPPNARAKLFLADPRMPPGCEIKGNVSSRAQDEGYRGIYHLPGCESYRKTKPERWFCSQADAKAARFRRAKNCPRQ